MQVNETKWSRFLAKTRALILYISIWIFDFGPEKLPGLSRNGPPVFFKLHKGIGYFRVLNYQVKCKTFLLIMSFIYMKLRIMFISMTWYVASLWNEGLGQLENSASSLSKIECFNQ